MYPFQSSELMFHLDPTPVCMLCLAFIIRALGGRERELMAEAHHQGLLNLPRRL